MVRRVLLTVPIGCRERWFWYYCTPDISLTSPFKELTPRTQRREHEHDASGISNGAVLLNV
jgi:hypothetical protein